MSTVDNRRPAVNSMNTSAFVPAAHDDGKCVPLATTGSGLPPSLAIVCRFGAAYATRRPSGDHTG